MSIEMCIFLILVSLFAPRVSFLIMIKNKQITKGINSPIFKFRDRKGPEFKRKRGQQLINCLDVWIKSYSHGFLAFYKHSTKTHFLKTYLQEKCSWSQHTKNPKATSFLNLPFPIWHYRGLHLDKTD